MLRRDYVGIGHTVNLAARLMGKAKGGIFVDESTYILLPTSARKYLIRSSIGLKLKGLSQDFYPFVVQLDSEESDSSMVDNFIEIMNGDTVGDDGFSRDLKRQVDVMLGDGINRVVNFAKKLDSETYGTLSKWPSRSLLSSAGRMSRVPSGIAKLNAPFSASSTPKASFTPGHFLNKPNSTVPSKTNSFRGSIADKTQVAPRPRVGYLATQLYASSTGPGNGMGPRRDSYGDKKDPNAVCAKVLSNNSFSSESDKAAGGRDAIRGSLKSAKFSIDRCCNVEYFILRGMSFV
jgi:hypothetical protein